MNATKLFGEVMVRIYGLIPAIFYRQRPRPSNVKGVAETLAVNHLRMAHLALPEIFRIGRRKRTEGEWRDLWLVILIWL